MRIPLRTRVLVVFFLSTISAAAILIAVMAGFGVETRTLLLLTGLTFTLVTLVSLALGWALSRAVTLPVNAVIAAAEAFAAGDRQARAAVTRQDELGRLTTAFNAMAEAVATSESQLMASKNRFRALAEHTSDLVTVHAPDGTFTYVSPSSQRILGMTPESLIGAHPRQVVHPEDRDRLQAQIANAAAGADLVVTYRCRHAEGREVWLETSFVPVLGPDGSLAQLHASSRDVTRKVANEAEILRLNNTLEARVRERTARLQAVNAELEAFNYSVSHDLRAPLRSIDGFSKLLLGRYEASLDAQGVDYLTRIRAAAQRMGALIDDLLTLSRTGRGDLKRQQVSISDLASATVKRLRDGDPDRKVEVGIEPNLTAQADGGLMAVVLDNLLANAWKFTGRTDQPHITVESTTVENETTFHVRDNGVGFDPTHADRLFGAFQRLHREDEFPGTGIGLATVAKIVRRHGGHIWAHSAPGKGTTLSFTLPHQEDS